MDLKFWLSDIWANVSASNIANACSVILNLALGAAFVSRHNAQNAEFKVAQITQEAGYKAAQIAQEAGYRAAQASQDASYKAAQSVSEASHQAVLKSQQLLLDEALHAKKTSFTRIDEKRAVAILKLDSALRAHHFNFLSFPLPALSNEAPGDIAIKWVIDLKKQADDVFRTSIEMGLFLPEAMCTAVCLEWCNAAVKYGSHFGDAFFAEIESYSFKALARIDQSRALKKVHDSVCKQNGVDDFAHLSRTLRNDLSKMFHGEDHPWGSPTQWPVPT
jgi:hypothetical protein